MKPLFRYPLFFILFFSLSGWLSPSFSVGLGEGNHIDTLLPPDNRSLRYRPDGNDFVIINGDKRFNRALYGTHTAFRVEGGDLPEFALYFPGIGGNLKLGVHTRDRYKWFNNFDTVEMRYGSGSIRYRLKDQLLGKSEILLTLLAMHDREGMLLKLEFESPENAASVNIIGAFGGASGRHPSRNGDLGADPPSVFYLTPEHSKGNKFEVDGNRFKLSFQDRKDTIVERGLFPDKAGLRIGDAAQIDRPEELINSAENKDTPVLVSAFDIRKGVPAYIAIQREGKPLPQTRQMTDLFASAAEYFKKLSERITVNTPDPYLNTLGGAINLAADGIWESPAYLHGAVAWRMWLAGWRGIYAGDALGWHDRAKTEFLAYSKMQLEEPDTVITFPDPDKNLARQKEKIGVGIFNKGYITRYPKGKMVVNHYDMNLGFIDAMVRHFMWTGDTLLMRELWPVVRSHLEWENRNFDQDKNGLYDAYAAIWASDAVQYSGGDVTHSSAYNYFENKRAGQIATILGEDPFPYENRAHKIKAAMDSLLWQKNDGWYAEYKDRLGLKLVHPSAGLWSMYHPIDDEVPDPFQCYQLMKYVENHAPRFPVRNKELGGDYYLLSTTDWMPYTWSVNNVAMAEMSHTALSFWKGNGKKTAFNLFKSLILESMYLSSSPGNFQQLSSFDRYRGELYRDFADPIGITSRALIEGLFGIRPDALKNELVIKPGFPEKWNYASIKHPDIHLDFKREGVEDHYRIHSNFKEGMNLRMILDIDSLEISSVFVNNQEIRKRYNQDAIGSPQLIITLPYQKDYDISIRHSKSPVPLEQFGGGAVVGEKFYLKPDQAEVIAIKDPQQILSRVTLKNGVSGIINNKTGRHTFFVQVKSNQLKWWIPVNLQISRELSFSMYPGQTEKGIQFQLRNHSDEKFEQTVHIVTGTFNKEQRLAMEPFGRSGSVLIPNRQLVPGRNKISIRSADYQMDTIITNWDLKLSEGRSAKMETIPLKNYFNDRITNIFRHKYLTPRPTSPTLQLPEQGIGNWASPAVDPEIDDQGLRSLAAGSGKFQTPIGITFQIPVSSDSNNVVFTSQWDNFPDSLNIALKGKASNAYLLMAGTTNPMQSRLVNGEVIVHYEDGSSDTLSLKNPDTWWPIEQDFNFDQRAFYSGTPSPWRVHLKTGKIVKNLKDLKSLSGATENGSFSDDAVPGGAATILNVPLDGHKELSHLELKAIANDVIIGLMGITLIR